MESIMTIRAPDGLQKILTQAAKGLGLARNALVLQILWDWVDRQNEESNVAIPKNLAIDNGNTKGRPEQIV